ncbi:hypothetical protein BHM03_00062417 [Ensete ventricosum]|nr:hypothetical protein BHM03_00062417 [Ensete ventricosum]
MILLRLPNSGIRARVVGHGLVGCRGSWLWPRLPTRGQLPLRATAAHRHGRLRPARRGDSRLQPSARRGDWLQGVCKGLPPAASPAASRGSGVGRTGLLAGKGSRRLRRGSSDDAVRVREESRASF